jgi:hypothetical protein
MVKSPYSIIFLSGQYLTGVQSFSISSSPEFDEIQKFGRQVISDRITNGQSNKVNVSWITSIHDPSFRMFGTGVNTDLIKGKYNFVANDSEGSDQISGAYLTSYSVNAQVNDVPTTSVGFEANRVISSNTGSIPLQDTFDHSFYPFLPSQINITSSFANGVTTSDCLQSFDLSLEVPRKEVKRLGQTYAHSRIPQFPLNVSLAFSVVKSSGVMSGIHTSYLDSGVLNKGSFTISMYDNTTGVTYTLPQMSLVGKDYSLGLDDNFGALSLQYQGTFTTGDFQLAYVNP